ncbi:putative iron-regulated membrane protein [Halopolyspora algeriensis]|uniref:Putative iron-regulated membrane protein n=1 Tax=Halopolyspora algeriensis TaxID=1500506 RepID=A0A368VZG2_9ACTN|nr:PepSY domain-containing protein [Halopolyspora algeriensis]RCW46819.1 putative iron-regulated membrane protein [Halopolyspora algeriensis]
MTAPHRDSAAEADPDEKPPPQQPRRRAALRPLLWRLHFFGGLLAAPVVLSLAVTGILYAWNPQIEQAQYRQALTAVAEGPARPLSEQVAAARATHPDWQVSTVTPPAPNTPGGEETTGVTLTPPGADSGGFGPVAGATTVYVDPASAQVTGQIVETRRPDEWLRNLHSSWRLGPVAEPITELAASWVLVSLLTGLCLWWPRSRRGLRRAFRLSRPGRARWRSLHGLLGVGFFVGLLLMVGTGLTWTNYAGTWIDVARSQFRSEAPSVSTQLAAAPATGGHQPEQPGEQTATPEALAGIDRVAATARDAGLHGVLELEPPDKPGQAWTAGLDDNRWPIEATTVAVDAARGQVTDRVDWDDHPLLAKATTLGVAYHQAQLFGLANQIGLTVLALGVIAVVAAGYRTWWLRRPPEGLGAPPGWDRSCAPCPYRCWPVSVCSWCCCPCSACPLWPI